MALIRYFPVEPKLNFLRLRTFFIGLAIAMTIGSVALFLTKGLNYGVDFRGGIVMEVQTDGPAQLDALRTQLNGLGLGDVTLQEFGAPDVVLINVPRQDGEDGAQEAAIQVVQKSLGATAVEYRRVESVGPKVGGELRTAAAIATVLAMLGIAIYVWVRFEAVFGVAALISLVHDVVVTVGFYALTGYEFNLATLAAVLTVAGYSINDTLVVYDRVREELRRYKKLPIPEVLNKAINQTLSRTILTSTTTLLALFGLFFFGGEVIRGFAAGMIFGILVGTYSSWGLGVQILSLSRLRPNSGGEAAPSAEATQS